MLRLTFKYGNGRAFLDDVDFDITLRVVLSKHATPLEPPAKTDYSVLFQKPSSWTEVANEHKLANKHKKLWASYGPR